MNRREQLGGLFWLGISVFVCIESWRNDIGSLHVPGPGFLPFWAAVVMGGFAILVLISATFAEKLERLTDLWKGLQWQRIVWLQCALFLYPLLLSPLGYLLTTFGLMMFSTAVIGQKHLWRQGLSAFIIVITSYLIFDVLLDVKLPKGVFGF